MFRIFINTIQIDDTPGTLGCRACHMSYVVYVRRKLQHYKDIIAGIIMNRKL